MSDVSSNISLISETSVWEETSAEKNPIFSLSAKLGLTNIRWNND